MTEQSRTELDHRESQEGRKKIKTLSSSFCVKAALVQRGPTRQYNTPTANLLPAFTSSTNHVPNSLALIWLRCCQQALSGLLFGGNSSINYLTSPFCTTMEGFLFPPCILLSMRFSLSLHPSYSCVPNPVVKMDVIGIDMPWNAKVSLGFSQPSTPEGK